MGEKTGKEATMFTSKNQPKNKGRPKNMFGPLQKESRLSNDDVKAVYKNCLASKPEELYKVIEKHPTVFTIATVNMLAQEMKGELTGRMEPTGRKIQKLDKNGNPKLDKNGNPVTAEETRPERRRSYEMIKYMIDRCFGRPVQADIVIGANIPEEAERRIALLFENIRAGSERIEPVIYAGKTEYEDSGG